jgi:hypothetical protein
LRVNATAAYRTTCCESLAADLKTQIEEPITRTYGDMRVEVVGPVFSRVFNPQNAIADRLKHVVEPQFSVQHRTTIENQERIPTRDGGYDIIVGGTTDELRPDQPPAGAEGRGGSAPAGRPELMSVSCARATTRTKSRQHDPSYSYGHNYRPPSAVFTDLAFSEGDASTH